MSSPRSGYPPLVARSIGAAGVTGHLQALFEAVGAPEMIRSDNGREFIAATTRDFLSRRGVTPLFVAKASPQQNCYIERFNGSLRDELLHGERFRTLAEARVMITAWVESYNNDRPHRSLGMRTPAAYAAYCATQNDGSPERGE